MIWLAVLDLVWCSVQYGQAQLHGLILALNPCLQPTTVARVGTPVIHKATKTWGLPVDVSIITSTAVSSIFGSQTTMPSITAAAMRATSTVFTRPTQTPVSFTTPSSPPLGYVEPDMISSIFYEGQRLLSHQIVLFVIIPEQVSIPDVYSWAYLCP